MRATDRATDGGQLMGAAVELLLLIGLLLELLIEVR
jgi:hypothetical protein